MSWVARVVEARAEIERLREVAAVAAEYLRIPGAAWYSAGVMEHVLYEDGDDRDEMIADAAHIASCDPAFMVRVYDADLAMLDEYARHAGGVPASVAYACTCAFCHHASERVALYAPAGNALG